MQENYVNFEIDIIEYSNQNEYVILARSPIGRAQILAKLIPSEMDKVKLSYESHPWSYDTDPMVMRVSGRYLFDWLFAENIRNIYDESLRFSKSKSKRLQIILSIQTPEIACIPWELIYDSRNREYLCLSLNTQLIRYLEYPYPFYVKDIELPLRILGMVASPRDLPLLDIEREKQSIQHVVDQHSKNGEKLAITWVKGGGWQELQETVQGGEWHIFHFVGHSSFDDSMQEGVIALEDENGSAQIITATELGRLLADSPNLLLVLLASCESAIGRKDIHSGIASTLVRRGIPAAIAVQSLITDQTSIEFTRSFYNSLGKHLSANEAIADARKALSILEGKSASWALPMFMTHSPHGGIWNIVTPKATDQTLVLKEKGNMGRPIRILFLAANPKGTDKLRLDEEVREIDEALLQKAEFRDKFELIQQWAVRISDLQGHLLRFQPDIVHFSGHGSPSSEIILEDMSGSSKPVSKHALSQLFSTLKDNIRCVVLNACYSESQAQAIAENIDFVIGMSKAIGDSAAISFAKSFYQALGYGRNVDTAFKLGIGQIDLEGLDDNDIPQLVTLNSDPKKMFFVSNE